MTAVVPLPVKPRPPRHRPLVCQGVYGRPGGDGLDSLARILLSIAADEDRQPDRQPEPRLRLSALKQGPA